MISRTTEAHAAHNVAPLQQSLEDQSEDDAKSVGGDEAREAHEAADKESAGIIGLLEVIETDFSANVAEITASEENVAVTTERQSKENEIELAKGCGAKDQGSREPRPGSPEVVLRQEWLEVRTRCYLFVFR